MKPTLFSKFKAKEWRRWRLPKWLTGCILHDWEVVGRFRLRPSTEPGTMRVQLWCRACGDWKEYDQ